MARIIIKLLKKGLVIDMNPQPKTPHVKLKPHAYKNLRLAVFKRDNWQCVDCGTTQNLTLSHKIHKGMGGGKGPGDTMGNCDTRCMSCHDAEERHLNGRIKK
jgi:5-methylcytosine-specific restriction endonuclease McrA